MNRAFGHLIYAFAMLCISTSSFAGAPISFHTVPAQPIAGQKFSIVATFVGGTPAGAFRYGSTTDLWLEIDGYPDYPLQVGTQTVEVPAQRAGTFAVLFTSPGFSPRPEYAFFEITVADAGPIPIPLLSICGSGI